MTAEIRPDCAMTAEVRPDCAMPAEVRLACATLVRTGDPAVAAARFASRLTALAANADRGSAVGWQLDRSRPPRVGVSLWSRGIATDDVAWCVDGIATTSRRRVAAPRVDGWWVHELRILQQGGGRAGHVGFVAGKAGAEGPGDTAVGVCASRDVLGDAWPRSGELVTAELVDALRVGGVLRVAFAPCGPGGARAVRDAVLQTWGQPDASGVVGFVGTPVRARVLLATPSERVPVRLRAVLRQGVPGVKFATLGCLGDPVADAIWRDPVDGATPVPAVAARLLCLPPAAGSRPVVGLATSDPIPSPIPARHHEPRGTRLRLGTALGPTGTRRGVHLGIDDAVRHLHVTGQSGSGKSTLLTDLVLQAADRGVGLTLLDPHGSTVDRVLACATPAQAARIDVARLGELQHPIRIAMWQADRPEDAEQSVADIAELFAQMFDPHREGIVGPRWERWFTLWALATIALFGRRASLLTLADLAVDAASARRAAAALRADHPDLARSLAAEYGSLGDRESADVVSWTRSKLTRFTGTTHLRSILGTGRDSLELARRIDEPSILLVDLAMPQLGTPAVRTLGTVLLQQVWAAVVSRSRRERTHLLLLDEAHLFQIGPLTTMLAEGRKFGLGVTVAHQHRAQLGPGVLGALEANAASLLAFRSSPADTAMHSERLGVDAGAVLPHLPTFQALASLLVGGVPTAPFTVTVDRPRAAKASAASEIAVRSHEVLVDPHRDAQALSAAEIEERLRGDEAEDGVVGERSALDAWLTSRAGKGKSPS